MRSAPERRVPPAVRQACGRALRATLTNVRPTRYRYGPQRWQVGDLWLPAGPQPGGGAVVVLLHGGWWRSIYTKALMNPLAGAIAGRGFAVWNVEYRRVGLFGAGGWPNTLDDVATAVDHLAEVPGVDPSRVVLCGHSAGGHLAMWAASRSRLPAASPGSSPAVLPVGVLSLAGVVGLGKGAVAAFMGGTPATEPERYAGTCPTRLLPLGVPQVLVHGLVDSVVPASMSERYHSRATAAGDDSAYVPIEEMGHRQLIDPAGAAWPVVAGHLDRLLSG